MQAKARNRDKTGDPVYGSTRESESEGACPTCGREWREIGVGEGDHPEWDVDNVTADILRTRQEEEAWEDFLQDTEK
jgi:hypothetical protein